MIKVGFNFISLGKEIMIRKILGAFNIKYALFVYEIISFNPVGSIINLLAIKFGISKAIIMIIVAFLL